MPSKQSRYCRVEHLPLITELGSLNPVACSQVRSQTRPALGTLLSDQCGVVVHSLCTDPAADLTHHNQPWQRPHTGTMLLSHRAGAGIAGTACGTARSQCTASCSGRQHAQPTQRVIRPAQRHHMQLPPANPAQRRHLAPHRPALAGPGLAAEMSFSDVDEDEGEEESDYTAVQVVDQANINPDFFDEHWADKVTAGGRAAADAI